MIYDFRNFVNPSKIAFKLGAFNHLDEILDKRRVAPGSWAVFMVDDYHKGKELEKRLPLHSNDLVIWISAEEEPKTVLVDQYRDQILEYGEDLGLTEKDQLPVAVLGIGGGTTMDYAKATRLMVTNRGLSHDFQGLDLIKNQGIYNICIPTISGTGAEVSMTTVLTGPEKKLGIKCDYTMPDQVLLDPELIRTVPTDQRFYTGMDCYIHNVESLKGTWKNVMGWALAEKSSDLCVDVFMNYPDGLSDEANEKLMVASYLGGLSVTYTQVAVCHALSYGLSYVLGTHHGVGNCIAFNQLEEFYADGYKQFKQMQEKQGVEIPSGIVSGVTEEQMTKMVDTAYALEHMWDNAFGKNWEEHISKAKIRELYERM